MLQGQNTKQEGSHEWSLTPNNLKETHYMSILKALEALLATLTPPQLLTLQEAGSSSSSL